MPMGTAVESHCFQGGWCSCHWLDLSKQFCCWFLLTQPWLCWHGQEWQAVKIYFGYQTACNTLGSRSAEWGGPVVSDPVSRRGLCCCCHMWWCLGSGLLPPFLIPPYNLWVILAPWLHSQDQVAAVVDFWDGCIAFSCRCSYCHPCFCLEHSTRSLFFWA